MSNKAFDVVRQAMATLEFYEAHYGHGGPYSAQKSQVIDMLRERAKNNPAEGGPFVSAFADALQKA